MEIFPAIDLMSRAAVRLTKGEFSSKKVYSSDPVEVMLSFKAEGARHLHVVDLDGARTGDNQNFDVVKDLCAAGAPDLEIGGGIRDMRRAESYLNLGVSRVILGTAAVENPAFLKEALKEWGEQVAVGVDVLDGFVRVAGWEKGSRINGEEFVLKLAEEGVKRIIYTDISRDGVMRGVPELCDACGSVTGPNGERVKGKFIPFVLARAIPGAVTLLLCVLAVYAGIQLFPEEFGGLYIGIDQGNGATMDAINPLFVLAVTFGGLVMLSHILKPFNWLRALVYAFSVGVSILVLCVPVLGNLIYTGWSTIRFDLTQTLYLCCIILAAFPVSGWLVKLGDFLSPND